jgi:hypothetical protein
MHQQLKISVSILQIIRGKSEMGQLVRSEEVLAELRDQGLLESEDFGPKTDWKPFLEQALTENPDLKRVSGRKGIPYYFSVQSLSETYARILVLKSEDPLWLIAEVVRENSQLYPRPVPVDSFREPPFELTREEIAECLVTMGEQKEFQDIAQTITSIGTLFLYSTQHLEPDHAFALAEWLDVGQVGNP